MSETASNDLSTATKSLSLNIALASFDFSLPFTLVSADGHSFSVDPLKLGGTSTVFAVMFSTGDGERSCTLAEQKQEIELYLKIVETGEVLAVRRNGTGCGSWRTSTARP
ncbi:hypothetical protein JCM8547_003073 [Rhodosporidiobolus lusitaniae]